MSHIASNIMCYVNLIILSLVYIKYSWLFTHVNEIPL
jgi:hypothetical protein